MKTAWQILQHTKKMLGMEDVVPEENILMEADRLTAAERNAEYGDFFSEAAKTAFIHQMILSESSEPWSQEEKDTLVMMVRKLVRHGYKKKRDNLVDLAGYAKLLQGLHEAA